MMFKTANDNWQSDNLLKNDPKVMEKELNDYYTKIKILIDTF